MLQQTPVLPKAKQKRLGDILDSQEEGHFFTIKEVIDFKYFYRCFQSATDSMASSGRDNGEDIQTGDVAPVMGDEGESHHF